MSKVPRVFVMPTAEAYKNEAVVKKLDEFITKFIDEAQGSHLTQWAYGAFTNRVIHTRWAVTIQRYTSPSQVKVTDYDLIIFVGGMSRNMMDVESAARDFRVPYLTIEKDCDVWFRDMVS